ncbi:MAG TPA: efflux RND transporter periplasmic adaptor subunit [Gammaproteobacteria bacterium]|nr:efflux RND transporter periplasmic adaptor subunit [Gammaproteobacteria bacterium]
MNRMLLYITLITLAMSLANTASDADTASTTPVTALVTTVPVVERRVAESLLVYGTLEPAPQQNLTLAATRDSIIAGVAVNSGERVRKGQILITLTPTPQSRAAWVQAKSGLSYTQSALERTRSLYKEHLATREQLAAAEKALSDAKVTLAVAQQAGGGGPLPLRASRDAVVTSVLVNTGEQVVANTALLTLATNGGLQARLGVAPEQAAALHSGLPVTLHSVFDVNKTVTGKIAAVGGMLDVNTGLLDVFVPLSHAARGFLPGTQVQGEITLSDKRSLAVPRTSVLHDAQGAYAFVITGHTAHRVNVHTGADDGSWIAVQGDIRAGEAVVTLGNYELMDGMQVREQAP